MFRQMMTICVVCMALCAQSHGQTQVFQNDFSAFEAAAGTPSIIDFELLPNGLPSQTSTAITDSFNYDALGAHFSVPVGALAIAGNSGTGHSLRANAPIQTQTYIHAELLAPASAVGAIFPGGTNMCAYDLAGDLIECSFFAPGGPGNFIGMVSVVPIKSVTFGIGSNSHDIDDFIFVPEPASAMLLTIAAAGALGRRRSARGSRR